MAIKVTMMKPAGLGSVAVLGAGFARVCETIAVGGTTTIAAQDGEFALVASTETIAVIAAQGSTPVATAIAATATTYAGQTIQPNETVPFAMRVGDKIAVAAFA